MAEQTWASYSALTLHRKCAQAWYYKYGLKLQQEERGSAPPREFGSWWSALRAAEALERGRKLGSLLAPPTTLATLEDGPEFDMETVTVSDVFDAAAKWWKARSGEQIELWEEELGAVLPQRLSDLYESWSDRWSEERKNERPLGAEVRWKRSLPRPASDAAWNGDLSKMPEVVLIGAVDEVYFDSEREIVVVRDHKTSKQLGTIAPHEAMMDSQLQLYAWGLTPQLREWGADAPRMVAYDRSRSTAPKSPQLTATGSLSKAVTDYDLSTYLGWSQTDTRPSSEETDEMIRAAHAAGKPYTDEQVSLMSALAEGQLWGKFGEFFATGAKKGKPKFGIYQPDDSIIEALQRPDWLTKWHQRTRTPLNLNIVRSHLRAAVDTATDMWRTSRRAELTGEAARSVTTQGCKFCDFATLCRAQMMGGPEGEYELAEYGLQAKDKTITTIGI